MPAPRIGNSMIVLRALIALIILGTTAYPLVLSAEARKYRIAAIIPLTGQVASLGRYVKQGIDLALKQLPSKEREKIELIYDDDGFDPNRTISAYRRLKSQGGLDAVLVVGSPPANALVPITERDKTILIAIGASDPTIANGREYSFIHWVTPKVLGDALAQEISRRDLKKIAFIVAEVSGTIADAQGAIRALKDLQLEDRVTIHETFLRETTDYRSILAKVRENSADGVVAILFPGALSSFAKQFREMKISAELIGMETFEDESEVKAAQGALTGAWYVNAADNSELFVKLFKHQYHEHPGWGAGNAFDTINLLSSAVSKVGIENLTIRDFLRSVSNYSGATGVYSASGNNCFTLPASVKKVTAHGFEKFNQK